MKLATDENLLDAEIDMCSIISNIFQHPADSTDSAVNQLIEMMLKIVLMKTSHPLPSAFCY